ncbi:1907_t:CDS:10, partial [Dentiscutata erythropus]
MHKYSDHKYFEQESKWNILGFLDECVLEPLERKIECYIKCLETIADTEEGQRREQAKQLLHRYRSGSRPDYQIAKNDRNSSINLYQPIFNNSLGVANIRGGTVIIRSKEKMPIEASSSDGKRAFDSTLDSDLISSVEVKKIKSTEESDEQNNGIVEEESQKAKNYDEKILSADESDLEYPREQMNDEDEENSLDDNSDEEDTVELADISFNSFVGSSKTDNKNYKWKLKNGENVRSRLIVMTKKAIEEAKQAEKVDTKILSVIRLGLSSIIDLSSEFKGGMYTWFGDNWIPLKKKVLSIIDLKVERFTGEVLELITKVENVYKLKNNERPIDSQMRQVAKIYFNIIDLFLENPYIFIKKDGRPQNHTEIQYAMILTGSILDIIFSDQRDYVRLIWGEIVSQVTNDSRRKIDLCIKTEDGTKELSHSECAREATLVKIIKDRSKSLRTNKCILDKYLESNIPDEALNDTAIFGLQLAALDGQLIGVDLLDEGLYFGFDGPAFKFPAQICSIDVLRQALEILYYFK